MHVQVAFETSVFSAWQLPPAAEAEFRMPTDRDAANAADVLRKSRRVTFFGMIMRSFDFFGMDLLGMCVGWAESPYILDRLHYHKCRAGTSSQQCQARLVNCSACDSEIAATT